LPQDKLEVVGRLQRQFWTGGNDWGMAINDAPGWPAQQWVFQGAGAAMSRLKRLICVNGDDLQKLRRRFALSRFTGESSSRIW